MAEEKLNLRLIAKDNDDLKVISAYLQDSIVLVRDMLFLQKSKTFLMMVNRFMWEDAEKGIFRNNKRIKSVVKFDNVIKVLSKNINQKHKDQPFIFLTIKTKNAKDQTKEVQIIFSGQALISIFVEEIDCLLDDLGKPWVVNKAPKHKI